MEQGLTTTTAAEPATLEQLTLEVKFYLGQTAQNIIEVGKRLAQAKELVPHGEWQNWLEGNFQLTKMSASRFMRVAERFGKSNINVTFQPTHLTSTVAVQALRGLLCRKAKNANCVASILRRLQTPVTILYMRAKMRP